MRNKFYIILLSFYFINISMLGRDSSSLNNYEQQESEINKVFSSFESGMNTGAVKEFSLFFNTETYISLENGISSYFSKDQSYYIIKDFFSTYKPIRFKFIKINESAETPFAIGQFSYSFQGMRRTSQVFVALKYSGDSWKISQITIN